MKRKPASEVERHEAAIRASATVRVKSSFGSDEINDQNVTFRPDADGVFVVPPETAQRVTTGVAGFYLAGQLTQAARLGALFSAIALLDDVPMKTALWAATTAEAFKMAGLPVPTTPKAAPAA